MILPQSPHLHGGRVHNTQRVVGLPDQQQGRVDGVGQQAYEGPSEPAGGEQGGPESTTSEKKVLVAVGWGSRPARGPPSLQVGQC